MSTTMQNGNNVYKVGDFVFAKVKYYPPWPAMITEVDKKGYGVIFYGTNEIGHYKSGDLCPYLNNKQKYVNEKSLKRRTFEEGIREIDEELRKRKIKTSSNKKTRNINAKKSIQVPNVIADLVDEAATSSLSTNEPIIAAQTINLPVIKLQRCDSMSMNMPNQKTGKELSNVTRDELNAMEKRVIDLSNRIKAARQEQEEAFAMTNDLLEAISNLKNRGEGSESCD